MEAEKVYLKALSILNDSLNGKYVDPNALQTANSMFYLFWQSVYQDRLREQNEWSETIEEKKERKIDE